MLFTHPNIFVTIVEFDKEANNDTDQGASGKLTVTPAANGGSTKQCWCAAFSTTRAVKMYPQGGASATNY